MKKKTKENHTKQLGFEKNDRFYWTKVISSKLFKRLHSIGLAPLP